MQPIPQNERFHDFADRREKRILNALRIANFNDTASNLQFVMTSLVLWWWRYAGAAAPFRVFVRSLCLVGPCSAYYHLNPNSRTLAVDRMAMSAAFGSLLVHAHASPAAAEILLWPSVLLSMLTVVYWRAVNDLRPYILLQYGGALSLLFTESWGVLPLYVLAKLCERFDHELFRMTNNRISGHTMKHIFAGLSPLFAHV